MTGYTPTYGLPYPESDTLITDSAAIVQSMAELIDAALLGATQPKPIPPGGITVPGSLVETFTASGTFTPPAGVTVVHVVVVGGGAPGLTAIKGPANWAYQGGWGGWGGEPVYFPDVAVNAPIDVTVGGSGTASSFGGLVGPAGATGRQAGGLCVGGAPTTWEAGGGFYFPLTTRNGGVGVLINGTHYGLGGVGGNAGYLGSAGSGGNNPPGGAPSGYGQGGTGGNGNCTSGEVTVGGPGGAGRVMIWSEDV